MFLGVFFGIVGIVYWFWSYEDGGTMMLVGTSPARLPARELLLLLAPPAMGPEHGRGPRPDASIAEGAGDIDSFPGSSIWPFVMGMGAFLTVLSLVFGIWLIFPGITPDPHRAGRRHRREPARRPRLTEPPVPTAGPDPGGQCTAE